MSNMLILEILIIRKKKRKTIDFQKIYDFNFFKFILDFHKLFGNTFTLYHNSLSTFFTLLYILILYFRFSIIRLYQRNINTIFEISF